MAILDKILHFGMEAIGEKVFLKSLTKAWKFAKTVWSGMDSDTKEKVVNRIVDPQGKTWDDEHYFRLDLAEASLEPEKQRMIEEGCLIAERYDRINGTHWFRNARVIITAHDDKPNAQGIRPGVIILEDLGARCDNPLEVFASMEAMGAMQDSSTTLEKFTIFFKNSAWPFLKEGYRGIHGSLDSVVTKMEDRLHEIEEAERMEEERINSIANPYTKFFARCWHVFWDHIKN